MMAWIKIYRLELVAEIYKCYFLGCYVIYDVYFFSIINNIVLYLVPA
jgi:hypothetical protein